jgi:hypothetical protein
MDERVVLVELSDAVVHARRVWRRRIAGVSRWSLAQGRPVDPDLTALILAARDEWSMDDAPDVWTRIGVCHCLYADVSNWCSMRRVLIPDHVPEALWTYLHYLKEHRQFGTGSDPFRELLRPLRCYGGLGPDGRPYPAGARLRVRCVCKIPYRPDQFADGA